MPPNGSVNGGKGNSMDLGNRAPKLFASGLWISMLEEWWCIFVSMALNTLDKVNLTSGNEWIYMGYGLLMFTV